ncbi:hypothetical protein M9H77_04715 [Catharanthus roseus]|uniref:Uncharacterized protein n=1 Tax=Catharanthus roseus TaxID=4058 RepID=A0ACC0CF71_CATRO|nr:hypothetical protein M9H77_04715 [Catharanthus roseus]
MEGREYTQVNAEPNDDSTETLFQKRRCCFCFSWSSGDGTPAVGLNWWQRIRTVEFQDNSFVTRGINAFKKLREWSEIVACPRWKTFIRRFNRSNKRNTNYRYDPLSYSLNFDEGPGQNGEFTESDDYGLRNFSVRYASIPASAKASMDLGKDGPSFV